MIPIIVLTLLIGADPAEMKKSLEGQWVVKTFVSNGVERHDVIRSARIQGENWNWQMDESSVMETRITKFDRPGVVYEIDLTRDRDQQTILGILKVEDGKMYLCTSSAGDRPTEFEAVAGSRNLLQVLERKKTDGQN
jgi:uncharacterized protein (TIGR03067 family)